MNAIQWLDIPRPPPPQNHIPFCKVYLYKLYDLGEITWRKARTNLHFDLRLRTIYYRSDRIATHMADKTKFRLVFTLSVSFALQYRILDIHCALPHVQQKIPHTTYVIHPRRFDAYFKHPAILGLLRLNQYGGKATSFIYYQVLVNHLRKDHISKSIMTLTHLPKPKNKTTL